METKFVQIRVGNRRPLVRIVRRTNDDHIVGKRVTKDGIDWSRDDGKQITEEMIVFRQDDIIRSLVMNRFYGELEPVSDRPQ